MRLALEAQIAEKKKARAEKHERALLEDMKYERMQTQPGEVPRGEESSITIHKQKVPAAAPPQLLNGCTANQQEAAYDGMPAPPPPPVQAQAQASPGLTKPRAARVATNPDVGVSSVDPASNARDVSEAYKTEPEENTSRASTSEARQDA
jgi:hypothetical protein